MVKKVKNNSETLTKTFLLLKKKLNLFKKKLIVKEDKEKRYELYGNKEYEVTSEKTGRVTKKNNAYFAGIILYKTYVGFYFMPLYYEEELNKDLSIELKNLELAKKLPTSQF